MNALHIDHAERCRRRSAFTLVELSIGTVLLMLLCGGLALALGQLRSLTVRGAAQDGLQRQADKALARIVSDLSRSGVLHVGGNSYPYLFDGGQPSAAFAVHQHEPATEHAGANDADFGPDREVVYLLPADADGDGSPDVDAQGELVWDATEYSLVVVSDATGVNGLQRRKDGAAPQNIARYVERVRFDDAASSGYTLPLDALRVRIWFRHRDEHGALQRYFVETTLRLRNRG